eukprot:7139776-Pyramimonas_sp.AAC.1
MSTICLVRSWSGSRPYVACNAVPRKRSSKIHGWAREAGRSVNDRAAVTAAWPSSSLHQLPDLIS